MYVVTSLCCAVALLADSAAAGKRAPHACLDPKFVREWQVTERRRTRRTRTWTLPHAVH
jgi:hypothetical protein